MDSIRILGVRVDDVTLADALAQVDGYMREPRLHQVATINPEFVMIARRDPEFGRVLADSDLNLPDGANLVRAAQSLGLSLRERVPGVDFVWYLSGLASAFSWKVFFLGGRGGVAGQAAARLQWRYRNLRVAGVFEGSPHERDEGEILAKINAVQPGILFVAYGAPAQDLWIARHKSSLSSVRVAVGVGGSFDYISRRVARAPRWMQDAGFEWLFRLVRQPRRARRQLALAEFTLLVMRASRNRPKPSSKPLPTSAPVGFYEQRKKN